MPTQQNDNRGVFFEAYSAAAFKQITGREMPVAQLNVSVSRKGTLRGIHTSIGILGQAKYVQCLKGAVQDVVVDLRFNSPTFGQHQTMRLDDDERKCVFIPEGFGHAFMVLSDEAMVAYLTSTPYDPETEISLHPFDPFLSIEWPESLTPIMSERDRTAMSVRDFESYYRPIE